MCHHCTMILPWLNVLFVVVAKIRWRLSRIVTSALRKSSGIWAAWNSNLRSVASVGLNFCLCLFAVLAKCSGLGRLGHGAFPISCSRISTKADVGLNKSYFASSFTCSVTLVAIAEPVSAVWLWQKLSFTNFPFLWVTTAFHGLLLGRTVHWQ